MDIPKYVGVVFSPTLSGSPGFVQIEYGEDAEDVRSATMDTYRRTVADYRDNGVEEAFVEQIGWDVYVSTRASANAPDAVHHGFEGPGA